MLRDTKMIALLAKHGASLDAPGRDGWTPLGLASRSNAKETVKALLDAKAVRPRTLIQHLIVHTYGRIPLVRSSHPLLFLPVTSRTIDHIYLTIRSPLPSLIAHRLSFYHQNAHALSANGKTALQTATENNRTTIVELLKAVEVSSSS